ARNEERSIGAAIDSVLAQTDVHLELIVLDDHSNDATAAIVREYARKDPRVRLESSPALPPGWCGKQHACQELAQQARHPVLVFMDADVRLSRGALSRMHSFLQQSGASLISGFPRQQTGTILEKLLIPLIHFVLLGFLPLRKMRQTLDPAYGAGCGQLMMARKAAYARAGGHAAIRASRHDGIQLPRAFRRAGLRTDLFDGSDVATCRMYENARDTWNGLAKNATEGLGASRMILPATLLLLTGQVLPWLLLLWLEPMPVWTRVWAGLLAAISILPRWLGVYRFHQSPLGALFHPLGIVLLLAIQWYAWLRRALHCPVAWKGRGIESAGTPEGETSNSKLDSTARCVGIQKTSSAISHEYFNFRRLRIYRLELAPPPGGSRSPRSRPDPDPGPARFDPVATRTGPP
ncbi:MAG TPA: glycosyltransferase family 2 protein, partial [Verrucomicrobiae bacterium]|nr:glycosyltransferase family 2 protein [Verrucomicrobiae bacterium]